MISIIVPTYNRLALLKKCVDSIITQQKEGVELIVVDDSSTDGTAEYLLQLSAENSVVKVILNKENSGVNFSRNRGIEVASREFILFLDSDDSLLSGSLIKIQSALLANKKIKHFLFVVSDRAKEFENVEGNKMVLYKDWLAGNISGDFTHVVLTSIMKKYLFFEEFRMFEHLNWLRTKKETAPQLLVNELVTQRDRQTADSLTLSSKLQNAAVIKSKFESEQMYYSLYHKDLKIFSPKSFDTKLLYTILLGIACNKKDDCKSLINYAGKWSIKALGKIAMLIPGSVIQYGIIRYSGLKRQ